MAEIPSNGSKALSALVAEMREAIIELAGDRALFDTRERWLERAARNAGISCRMAKTIFYNERCNPSAETAARILKARDNLRTKDKGNRNVANQAADEYQELLARIERLENALRLQPSEPCGAADNAVRRVSRQQNRAVD